jgi:hypothetical protein
MTWVPSSVGVSEIPCQAAPRALLILILITNESEIKPEWVRNRDIGVCAVLGCSRSSIRRASRSVGQLNASRAAGADISLGS